MMTELEKYKAIADCNNLEELKEVFDLIGPVAGSQKEYSPERLKEKVDQMITIIDSAGFYSKVPFNNLTRTYGIRAKVMELLWYRNRGI